MIYQANHQQPLSGNKINNLVKWALSVTILSISLIVWLVFIEQSAEAPRLWARYTARISFFYFILAFSASSLHYFFPNGLTLFIRQNRRNIGLSFAFAHTIHLFALISFISQVNEPPNIIFVLSGGIGYMAIYAMVFTSTDRAVEKLGFKRWKQLHWFGANYTAAIFTYSYIKRLISGEDIITYSVLSGIILTTFLARWIYSAKSKY